MKKEYCQEVLQDFSSTGKERPWARNKLANGYIAIAYDSVNVAKAERMRDCASFLLFAKDGDSMRLHKAHFCRVRLCPICAWRRSLKTFGQVSAIVDKLGDDYRYIFLTLTVKNVSGAELSAEIDKLGDAFNLLMKYKRVKQASKGYFRSLEITHNLENDTYHPHIHVILAVKPSYFKSRYYIKNDEWSALWKRALGVNYSPRTDIRAIKVSRAKAVAEVSKYAVKAGDIICFDDWDLTVDTVRVLDEAIDHRRLTTYGGVFRDVHKMLHLDDNEDGDLTHVEADKLSDRDDLETIAYAWHSGYCQYVRR